jgi:hypothetical protein
MKSFILTISLLHFITFFALAQDKKTEADDHYKKLEEKYKRLKDSLALTPFVPAVSSVIINYQQIEVNFFTSLISTNKYRDDHGQLLDINARQTYLYNTVQVNYGVSKNARLNVGLNINSIFGRIDQDKNSSPFKVFGSDAMGNSRYARAITAIGPRVGWRPFKNNYNFTVQSSFSFPAFVSTEDENILGRRQIYFLAQFLYNQPLSKRLFLFSQLSTQYGFERDNAPAVFYTPVSVYLSYLIPRKTILFALFNYVPVFTKNDSWTYNRYITQVGGGVQYQISRHFLINTYYAANIKGKNYPDFDSYNISLRYISLKH